MKTLLIATTNEGKYKELLHVLDTQPFHILSLKDLETPLVDPEETEPTLDGNAMLKATYYGEKTGYMTLADDTGLFIHSLAGWPGIKSARIAHDSKERREAVLEKLQGKKDAERDATFHTTLALYDPDTKSMFLARGEANGRILEEEPSEIHHNFGYDPIFFVTEAEKTFDQMTNEEKNAMSHRGKAISQIKYYLANQYGGKHIIVPCAITVKDGKVLLARRNDPHNSEFHGKWE
ncbi:MAG: RdgB/HAM1 family non-canonical purine NTP pyrophosphatase, partial [Candidatus Magasanikbacteria bacterium]